MLYKSSKFCNPIFYIVQIKKIKTMLQIKVLQFNPDSEEWAVVLSSEIAYSLHIEVPTKWALEVIKSGKFVQTSEKDGWITYRQKEQQHF